MADVFASGTEMFEQWLVAAADRHLVGPPQSDFFKICSEEVAIRHHDLLVQELKKDLGRGWEDADWRDLRGALNRLGFDGIVYHNISEGDPSRADNVAWIVWNPTQIKSAIGNRGTFDPDDPVITNPRSDQWIDILDLPNDVYVKSYNLAVSQAGEGEFPRELPKGFRPTFDKVFEVQSKQGDLSIIYSMDPSGELAVEYVRMNSKRMKPNPVLPPELGRLIEVGDTVLNYDSAQGEDFYDLYDLVYTRRRPTTGEIEEVAGMLNDNGVFAVLSGDTRDLGKYFQKVGVLGTVAVAQGPKNPEVSRINAEKKRRKM